MKAMKKNIVMKLLMGVVTTTITATAIAVPVIVSSNQNKEEVSVIADEDIQAAGMVGDTEITSDETNIVKAADAAEEIIPENEGNADDGQKAVVEDNTDDGQKTVAEGITDDRQKAVVEDNSEKEVDTTEGESGQDLEYEVIPIDDTVMYAAANCNIRSGAGTGYDKIGKLSYAQEVTVNGKVEADGGKLWYVIKTEDGSTQMVSASMLSETKPAVQTSSNDGSGSSGNSGGNTEDTGNSQTVSDSSQTASSEQPHEHNWIAHTSQRWVSQIVTVVDEPERYEKYSIYGMYWYDTGIWEETRDHDRFLEWELSEYGMLYPAFHLAKREDSPLFIGYDELGHAMFQGDHVIRPGHYDYFPAVTHEEDQGYYEDYVDYYYCDCGATK